MNDLNINERLLIVKTILDDVHELMVKLKPIFKEISNLDETRRFREDGTFNKAAILCGNIAKKCKKLEFYPYTEEFLSKIKN